MWDMIRDESGDAARGAIGTRGSRYVEGVVTTQFNRILMSMIGFLETDN